ncbi:MAG: hypothetical protein LW832_02370 [Parachlamydia sp.]|jgi:hypothetical protein|nr:hypothetical protein [Parachlamydia sp.]
MSTESVNSVNTSSEIQSQEQTSQTSHPSGGSGLPSKVSTMEDLKNASPEAKEVYDKMMLGIATNMVNEIKDHQERLKKAWREMNR